MTRLQYLISWLRPAAQWPRRFMGTRRARLLVLGLFVAQAVLLAFIMRPGVPPDETNHIKFIEFYASHSLSPIFDHQKPTYNLGDKTREVDYVYHYVMSFVYRILPLATGAKYIVIRLFSVAVGLGTFITLGAIAKRLRVPEAATTVALLVLTNLPMVLMLSAAINNDALVWLGVALATLLLLRLWEKPSWLDLLLLAEIVIIGGMVKRTMLAFGVLFGILGIVIFVRNLKRFVAARPASFDWRIVLVAVILAISTGLAIERIGGNVVRFHTPTPSCEQVQGTEACAVFWASARIRHNATLPPENVLPVPVFVVYWAATSLFDNIDIQTQGWRHDVTPLSLLPWLLGIVLVAGIGSGVYGDARRWKHDQSARQRLLVVCTGLCIVLIHLVVNYSDYQDSHIFGQALNGRYILPGILLLGLLASYYWSRLLAAHQRLLLSLAAIVVAATIAGSGLIMMLRNPELRLG